MISIVLFPLAGIFVIFSFFFKISLFAVRRVELCVTFEDFAFAASRLILACSSGDLQGVH